MTPASTAVEHLDGTSTESFEVDAGEATLLAILRELFEEHWAEVVFGPCIEGAVFEGCFSQQPRLAMLDGYLTVEVSGAGSWHFHLCIGPHRGSPTLPTPPALAEWRRCRRAALFVNRDAAGRPSAWGFRMWNGRAEQMITVFLPNPWLDPVRRQFVDTPDWSRLDVWMRLRERYAGVPPEPPPADVTPPRSH